MLTKCAISAVALAAFSGCAFAADPMYPATTYPAAPPPISSPVYGPTSMVTADASLSIGLYWFSGKSNANGLLDLDGRVNLPIANGWNLMPEAYLSHDFGDGSLLSGSLHFYKKLPNAAIGPFVAVSGASGGGPTGFTIGGEARTYMQNASLTGQVSHTGFSNTSYNIWQFGAWLDYYLSTEAKLTGGIEVATASGSSVVEGSLKLTKHVPNTRLNVFGAAYVDAFSGGGPSTGGAVEVGATVNLGPIQNMVEQDRERPFRFHPLYYFFEG